MSRRRQDQNGSALAAGLVLIALCLVFILAYKGLVFICSAFAHAPRSRPVLLLLLAVSILLTLLACATQGDAVALCLAAASWTALVAYSASITRRLAQQAAVPRPFDDVVNHRW